MERDARVPRVVIIDYQLSNLFSVERACEAVGIVAEVSSDPEALLVADAAILPGVGAFGAAMENLHSLKLVDPIKECVARGKPFLGICLGMQLLMTESEEFGATTGLDLVPGTVKKFHATRLTEQGAKVPQIGWNRVLLPPGTPTTLWNATPLKHLVPGAYMYFVHSLYCIPGSASAVLSVTNYAGIDYCSSVRRGNIFATQFHPEKSGHDGVRIYREWKKEALNQMETLSS